MAIAWAILVVALPLILGWGMNALGYSPPDFMLARGSVIISALLLAGMTTVWLAKNWSQKPMLRSIGLYGLSVAILIGGMIYIGHREAEAQSAPGNPVNGNCNFPGGTNNGTINCPVGTSMNPASDLTHCPPDTNLIIENSTLSNNGIGLSYPAGMNVCIIGNSHIEQNRQQGIEVRPQ